MIVGLIVLFSGAGIGIYYCLRLIFWGAHGMENADLSFHEEIKAFYKECKLKKHRVRPCVRPYVGEDYNESN